MSSYPPGSLSLLIFLRVSYFLNLWWSESSLLCTGFLKSWWARAPLLLGAGAQHVGSVTVAHGSGGTARWLQSTGSAALVQGLLGGIFPDQELRQADSCPPGGSEVKASAGDLGFIPGSGRSPGEENGTPLQYSCWRIPWTEEPGRLQSMGSQRVRHDWVTSFLLPVHRTARELPFLLLLLSLLRNPASPGCLLRPCVHWGCLVEAALVHQDFLFSTSILALWVAFLLLWVIRVQSWVFILLFPLLCFPLNPALPSAKS